LIEAVVEKLSDYRIRNSWLQDRWSAIQTSLEDEEERVFCEAAGALGIDPYLCDEGETQAIEGAAAYFDNEALLEFLASQRGQQPGLALKWLETAEAQLGEKAALPAIAEIAGKLGLRAALAPLSSPQPWQLGYRLAEECRAFVDLNPERIFADVADIAALFGRRGFTVASGRVRGLRAEAYRDDGAPRIIVADLPVPQSRTFAMMRAIGDFLAFQQEGRSPITDVYSYRQGVGRSFAVEMLAPAETILQMERDGMTPDEIASARNVSELAISWHLENHRAQPV
jgi:hypothetical protein